MTLSTPSNANQFTVSGSCPHDCPDTCVWDVTVRHGRAVSVRGNPEHPTTQGQLCPKVNRFVDRVYHPDRLISPMRRVGNKGSNRFEPIRWDEAIGTIAKRLGDIIAADGAESILQFSFDGTQGVIQKGILADRFFDTIGASDIGRDLCGVTAYVGAQDVIGTPYGIDPLELSQAKTILLWGTNTFHTNRHLWPTIAEAQAAGATVVAVDPISTPTATRADHHFQIKPGSDVTLVAAMVKVMYQQGLIDPQWLQSNTTGWDELLGSLDGLELDEAARLSGIKAERIVWLARLWANNRPSAIRTLVGPEHRANGREIMRALALLPSVTGAWQDFGGGLSRSTQVYFESALAYPSAESRPPRRRLNMAMLGHWLTKLDPPLSALFVHNSNPAVICPDQGRVLAGLKREDLFTVVIEQFMTDTAMHADIVLPATTQMEHLDLGIAWGHLYLSLNQPAIAPVGDALPNTEIFRRLASAMGLTAAGLGDSDESLIRQLLDSDHPWLAGISYETLSDQRTKPWVRLRVPHQYRPDGPFTLSALDWRHKPKDGPLSLITRKQHIGFLNTNYAPFPHHQPAHGAPQLTMHPQDADERGLGDGDHIVVFNHRGELELTLKVSSTEVQPGLVSAPFGWWGKSVNTLTNPDIPEDHVGSAAFHDTTVEVRSR